MKNDLMKRSRSHGSQDEDYDRARRFRKNDSIDSPLASRSNSRSNSIESRGRPLAKTVSVSRGNSFNRSASRSTSIEAGISISRGIDINNSNHKRALTFQNDSIDMEEPASLMENLSLNDHPPTQNGKWGGPSLRDTMEVLLPKDESSALGQKLKTFASGVKDRVIGTVPDPKEDNTHGTDAELARNFSVESEDPKDETPFIPDLDSEDVAKIEASEAEEIEDAMDDERTQMAMDDERAMNLRAIGTIIEQQELEYDNAFLDGLSMDDVERYESQAKQNMQNIESDNLRLQDELDKAAKAWENERDARKAEVEELQNENDKLKRRHRNDNLRNEKDIFDLEKELDLVRKEQTNNGAINSELEVSRTELRKLNNEIIELKASLMQSTKDKTRLEKDYKEIEERVEDLLKDIMELRSKARHTQMYKEEIQRLQHKIKTSAYHNFQRSEKIKRTTSIASLSSGKQIMMMANEGDAGQEIDDEELLDDIHLPPLSHHYDATTHGLPRRDATIKTLPLERAEERMKNFKWPKLASLEFETWRRLFYSHIHDARSQGIPDELIRNSIVQFLMSQECTLHDYARLTQKYDPSTLDGVMSIIAKLDPREQQFSSEERFKLMKFKQGDDAMRFMNRIQCQFRDMYGLGAPGEKRRIKAQFVEGYIVKGVKLSPNEKKLLSIYDNLTDLSIAAQEIMDEKVERMQRPVNLQKSLNAILASTQLSGSSSPVDQGEINTLTLPQQALPQNNIPQAVIPQTPRPQPVLAQTTRPQAFMPQNAVPQQGNNQRRRATRSIPAPPGVKRISMREYQAGQADGGGEWCMKCLQYGHTTRTPCIFYCACLKCSEPAQEQRHSTRFHDEHMARRDFPAPGQQQSGATSTASGGPNFHNFQQLMNQFNNNDPNA